MIEQCDSTHLVPARRSRLRSATGLDGESFASALLAEEAIAVMPGESFGASAAGHIRVAMTLPDDAFAEAFARVVSFATARAKAA